VTKPRYEVETEGADTWLVIRIPISLLPETITLGLGDVAEIRRDTLTRREREVFDMIMERKQNKEIADALHIEVRTVKYHVSEVLRKMHVSSRAELWFVNE